MPIYVSLVNWTEQGIKNFPDTIRRAEEFSRFVQGHGGKVRESLWTVGEYDLVQLSEFTNDEKAFAAFLRLESAGNVRTRTMRAFNAKEMEAIIQTTRLAFGWNTAAGAERAAGCDRAGASARRISDGLPGGWLRPRLN